MASSECSPVAEVPDFFYQVHLIPSTNWFRLQCLQRASAGEAFVALLMFFPRQASFMSQGRLPPAWHAPSFDQRTSETCCCSWETWYQKLRDQYRKFSCNSSMGWTAYSLSRDVVSEVALGSPARVWNIPVLCHLDGAGTGGVVLHALRLKLDWLYRLYY